ncbi:hypothetical protein [Streptomyces sp. G45]|uniref:hypothetical protein n=1 Tax=Streptomyces sp. G45 TaxID=3406627 RepID=UPI003C273173
MPRRPTAVLLGALTLTVALAVPATAAPATAVAAPAAANPAPLLPGAEPLITEGISVEGPLINNLGLPTLL